MDQSGSMLISEATSYQGGMNSPPRRGQSVPSSSVSPSPIISNPMLEGREDKKEKSIFNGIIVMKDWMRRKYG